MISFNKIVFLSLSLPAGFKSTWRAADTIGDEFDVKSLVLEIESTFYTKAEGPSTFLALPFFPRFTLLKSGPNSNFLRPHLRDALWQSDATFFSRLFIACIRRNCQHLLLQQ